MYVMFQLRPFTVHNVFPCFYGPNKVILLLKTTKTRQTLKPVDVVKAKTVGGVTGTRLDATSCTRPSKQLGFNYSGELDHHNI